MRVLIIGAGVGGLTLAHGLHKAGIEVLVIERQTEKTENLAGYGLHIDRNGRHALRSCLPLSNWTRLQTVFSSAGTQQFFRDTQFRVLAEKDDAKLSGKPAFEVERSAVGRLELRDVLLDGLDSASCSLVHRGRTFVRYEQLKDGLLRAHFSNGTWEDCDLLVGADGPKSPVRRQYMPSLDRVDLGIRAIAGRYILDDERIQNLPTELTSGALNNIVPSGIGWMFTSAWGSGQSSHYIVWAYVVPVKDSAPILDQMHGLELRDHVLRSVKEWSPNLRELVEGCDLSTIKCLPLRTMPTLKPWESSNVTLLGDAIHNMTPMAGMGANTALRDAEVLTRCLVDVTAGRLELIEAIRLYEAEMRGYANAAVQWSNWEAWPENGQSCYIDTQRSIPCGQGRVSLYSIQAKSPEDIQAGICFAQKHNLRVAIRNTGHDFAGRSVAPESLQINTHEMSNKKAHKDFKPIGSNGKGEGPAITVGAGVQLYDMYKWLGEHDLMVVGVSSHGVGIAGGYIQGGGHSILAAIGGMASDHVLEFRVVVADGRYVIANAYQNTDIFWALRGGGGGTWGIVTSVTVRAFRDPPIVTFSLSGGAPFGNESYWEAVKHFHAFLPKFNDAGGNMYYWLLPDLKDAHLGHVSAMTASGGFRNVSSKAAIDRLMRPLVKELGRITGTPFNYTSTLSPKASTMYTATNEPPDEVGRRFTLGSRIVTRDFLKSADGPGKVTDALRSLKTYPGETVKGQNAIQGLIVAGPAMRADDGLIDSALHPVWRKALLHIVLARGWDANTSFAEQQAVQRNLTEVEVPILKQLEPHSNGGAYLNEADGYEQDFQNSFWGSNYPRLYKIKQKWDKENLFIVRSGVGSEDWDDEALCRV
ncbi:hypothetical protein ACHAPJ_008824 [Fusarium lateritium]